MKINRSRLDNRSAKRQKQFEESSNGCHSLLAMFNRKEGKDKESPTSQSHVDEVHSLGHKGVKSETTTESFKTEPDAELPMNISNSNSVLVHKITSTPKMPKLNTIERCHQFEKVVSREMGELANLVGIVSASGTFVPPVFGFP
ncbi:unnamed protein product [Lepeophtheirus salmonis]|uniref:(salmon louse) hypothetical protein n=1 Tax=Lepeophtheirus salmonis TaxID=72036 RepID=A0A7R8H3D3_LEPSM|nr:unnamed protein product [Lepeophtheirus salmonis]CAF2842408.1 unnamed protein product [Lepeophtheirus salmonis]